MARPIVLSNGNVHVGLNRFGEVHDFYYPYVGLENHAAAKMLRHRVGVWVENRFSWLDDGSWSFTFQYHTHSLVGYTTAYNGGLGVTLEFDDAVDSELDVFMRNIHVINHDAREREIRLFMHQVFDIGDSAGNIDTVQYLPNSDVILHYRGRRAFVVGGVHASTGKVFDQYSVGLFGIEGHSGTYADAEDGVLSGNNVEHGRVDSVIGFNLVILPHASSRVNYWLAVGKSEREALDTSKIMREQGVLYRLLVTGKWWREWIKPAEKQSEKLENKEWREDFIKSLMLIKAHMDNRGAIIASTDTTMLNYARDAYGYCWPRDGAYAIWPFIRLGYTKEPLAFFDFCQRVIHPNGYLMHKYQADGALGSSWHPYIHKGVISPPIQEDETAGVLFMFAQFWFMHKDKSLLDKYYQSFIVPMANFLSNHIDEKTGLPRPSYDLWEERFLTTTYTTSVVYAALLAAAEIAEAANDNKQAVRWRAAAEDIGANAHKLLYNEETQCFYKGLRVIEGKIVTEPQIDTSAVFGAFMYGLFPHEGPEMKASIKTIRQHLSMPLRDKPGLARYENDYYRRVSSDIPGNPWFITTLWFAQYDLELGNTEEATQIIDWCRAHMLTTGVLSEQINPYDDTFVSVAPLTWSQAEFASTLLDFMNDEQE